ARVGGACGVWPVRSALVRRSRLRDIAQAGEVVLDLGTDLAEPGLVLVPVVAAEEQIKTGIERRPDVGLGAAAVAAVGCGERTRGKCRGHVVDLFSALHPRVVFHRASAFPKGTT